MLQLFSYRKNHGLLNFANNQVGGFEEFASSIVLTLKETFSNYFGQTIKFKNFQN
jgi:hypothetical protein